MTTIRKKDSNGIVFDLNWKGWQLTRGKIKNAAGGLRPAKAAAARKKLAPERNKIAAAREKVAKRGAVRVDFDQLIQPATATPSAQNLPAQIPC